jgi:Kef-type K+ transport system membrane component KefB
LVEEYGETDRTSVTVTVGATILTDILSLLVLAVSVTTHKTGFSIGAFILQLSETAVFIAVVLVGFGLAGRWLFVRFGRTDDAGFMLLLAIVSSAAVLAEAINLEGILGAFVAGLAVNTAVRASPAKEKLEFLGNALFIPAFFIATGFLIDLGVFVRTVWSNASLVAAVVGGLIVAKWMAAQIVGRAFWFSAPDRGLMGSLTLPQVAATLAIALVGYQAVNAAGERLIDTPMLNTVLVLVVVSSVLGPVLTVHFLKSLGGARGKSRRQPVAPSERAA